MTSFHPSSDPPWFDRTAVAPHGLVASVDGLASAAGVDALGAGGSAADAAVTASAVLAVTTQHMCGMGGDLIALVHDPASQDVAALLAIGRAGSGADPDRLRADGHDRMPFRGDVRSVTVPGCVDGWAELHARYGRLPWSRVLEPALGYARDGFPVSPLLALATHLVADLDGAADLVGPAPPEPGEVRRRPRLAAALGDVAAGGRDAWYRGEFGRGLVRVGAGEFTPDDVAAPQAGWAEPLTVPAFGGRVAVTPAPTQGYLVAAGAWLADHAGLPREADSPEWAHLLIEICRGAGHDRPEVLHENADLAPLLDAARLAEVLSRVDRERASAGVVPAAGGGTIYLAAADADGMVVSLSQSNAADFGAWLTVPEVGVFLHNRGIGFSLRPGHPAEYGPGRRPPHTLAPSMLTGADGSVTAVGTMGGDAQPQVVLQVLARLAGGATPAAALGGPRFSLAGRDGTGFDTWHDAPGTGSSGRAALVRVEAAAPWTDGLRERGHTVEETPLGTAFGHAHVVGRDGSTGMLRGAADPRLGIAAAVGY